MIIQVDIPTGAEGPSIPAVTGVERCRITFDQSRRPFSTLTGLARTIDRCIDNGIPFTIEGLPACVLEEHLGSLMHGLVMQAMGADRPPSSVSRLPGAAQLMTCRHCVLRDDCPGVGPLPGNHGERMYRIRKEHRLEAWESVRFRDERLDGLYRRYLRHIAEHPLELTDRAMTFPRTVTPGAAPQYDERFVYFCRYLTPDDIPREKALLMETMQCREYMQMVFAQWYERGIMPSVACTFAAGQRDRESVYLYFATQQLIAEFLDQQDIKPDLRPREMLWFLGVDFRSGDASSYKVYTRFAENKALLSALRAKGVVLPDEFLDASGHYLLCRRCAPDGMQTGLKLECSPLDRDALRRTIKQTWGIDMEDEPAGYTDEIVALDLVPHDKPTKLTIYARKCLRGVDYDLNEMETNS